MARVVVLGRLIPELESRGHHAIAIEPDANGLRGWVDLELARRHMYADCDDGSVAQALGRMRKQALAPYTRPCPLEAFPDTPATYVVSTERQLAEVLVRVPGVSG